LAAKDASAIEIDGRTPLPNPLPAVAARVNGREIPTTQVVLIAEPALRSGAMKGKPFAYRQTLQQLVIRELLLDEAVARGIQADTKAIDQAYDETRVRYKDDEAWREALQHQGFTPESYRAELRSKHTANQLLTQEARKLDEPSDAEVRAFFEENRGRLSNDRLRAAHILIRVAEDAREQQRAAARTRAEEILARLGAGESFAALAKEFSADQSSSSRGGEVPVFGRGQMPPAFEAAAYALQPGQLSPVVAAPYGYQIVKLLERIPGPPVEFEAVKAEMRRQLEQQRRQQHIQAFVNGLRRNAKVETFL
jgi:peptidyl-prolyl cis-trans isomerase C